MKSASLIPTVRTDLGGDRTAGAGAPQEHEYPHQGIDPGHFEHRHRPAAGVDQRESRR